MTASFPASSGSCQTRDAPHSCDDCSGRHCLTADLHAVALQSEALSALTGGDFSDRAPPNSTALCAK
jgi:hypothetical protein